MGGDMSQQHPQWGQPQQPQQPQPGWGAPQQTGWGQQPGWGAPPPQPPKRNTGKTIAIIAAAFVGVLVIGAVASNGDTDSSSDTASASSTKPTATATTDEQPAAAPSDAAKAEEPKADKPKVVTFKVWGKAPAGALGPLDINYGSDSDSRQGHFKNGKFEATLPLDDDALFYNVMAQLQGSGDIQCSVTIDGETKKGHASGDYNICDAQLSAGFLGGWS